MNKFTQNYPLHQAASLGAIEHLKKLVKQGEKFFKYRGPESEDYCDGDTVLHTLIYHNEIDEIMDVLPILIDAGIDIFVKNDWLQTHLHYAARLEDGLPLVKYLIEQGLGINDRDKNGLTPLHHAIISSDMTGHDDFEIIEYLLESGADPNLLNSFDGSHALISQMTQDYYEEKKEKDEDKELKISKSGKLINTLIKHGVNINVQDKNGMTGLHYYLSVCLNSTETQNNLLTVKKYIELGMLPNIKNNKNILASDIAYIRGFNKCEEFLKSV